VRIMLVHIGPPERRIVLSALPAMIGRDASAEVWLEDSWVGQFQCILDEEGGRLRVLDLGARTGTFVNGERVKRAVLLPGDTLTVGRTDFFVNYECLDLPPVPEPMRVVLD